MREGRIRIVASAVWCWLGLWEGWDTEAGTAVVGLKAVIGEREMGKWVFKIQKFQDRRDVISEEHKSSPETCAGYSGKERIGF